MDSKIFFSRGFLRENNCKKKVIWQVFEKQIKPSRVIGDKELAIYLHRIYTIKLFKKYEKQRRRGETLTARVSLIYTKISMDRREKDSA